MPSPQPGLHLVLKCCALRPSGPAGAGYVRLSFQSLVNRSAHEKTISDSLMPKRSGFGTTEALGSKLRTAWSRDYLTTHPSQRPQCGSSIKTVPKHNRVVNDVSQLLSSGEARRDQFHEIPAQETRQSRQAKAREILRARPFEDARSKAQSHAAPADRRD